MKARRRHGAHRRRSFGQPPAALRLAWILFLAVLAGVSVAWGTETPDGLGITGAASAEDSGDAEAPEAVPDIELESLLKLPSGWQGKEQRRQGLTSGQWRGRFAELMREREETERGMAQARRELDAMAGEGGTGTWQMGAPGSNNTEVTPMSYKHRELIRAAKEQLEEIRRKERALGIEADIAGVPRGWRTPEPAAIR